MASVVNLSANALVLNDDCQTALDVARAKGHGNVVRAIEVCPDFLSLHENIPACHIEMNGLVVFPFFYFS